MSDPRDALLAVRLLRRRHEMLRRDRWPRGRLEEHRAAALRRLRAHARARSPFYRELHAGREDAPLAELPVVTKAQLMERFDDAVTDRAVRRRDVEAHLAALEGDGLFRGRYRVSATSGSSGRRGVFLFDRSEWADLLASWVRGHAWTERRLGPLGLRVALVVSTVPWHLSARVGASFGRWVRTLRLDAGQPTAAIVAELNAFRPGILVAYPSVAGALAAEALDGRLRIAPELVFTGAEVLTEGTRRLVEAAWGGACSTSTPPPKPAGSPPSAASTAGSTCSRTGWSARWSTATAGRSLPARTASGCW